MKDRGVGGEGKVAEVDGGYVKTANLKEERVDRRFVKNQNGKRNVVVIVRERGGNLVPAVFKTEVQAAHSSRPALPRGTVINAAEVPSWDGLHQRLEMKRITTIRRGVQP